MQPEKRAMTWWANKAQAVGASRNSGAEQRWRVSSLYSSSQPWTSVAFRSTIILVWGPDPSWLAFSCVSYEGKRISPGREARKGGCMGVGVGGWQQVRQQRQNGGCLTAITGTSWSSSCRFVWNHFWGLRSRSHAREYRYKEYYNPQFLPESNDVFFLFLFIILKKNDFTHSRAQYLAE